MDKDEKKNVSKELDLDALDNVSGGGAFDDAPRVPTNPIDDDLRDKA